MIKGTTTLLLAGICLVTLLGCQTRPAERESREQPKTEGEDARQVEEALVFEEGFEGGDSEQWEEPEPAAASTEEQTEQNPDGQQP